MDKRILVLALPTLALMTLAGCKGQASEADSVAQQGPKVIVEGFTDTVELELVPWEEEEPEAKPVARKQETQQATTRQAAAQPVVRNNGKAETIYVETEGAQGRVWGHVTMKGDRGSGTIHDWDENTLSVTVTRHGNELFAVDQNSRQYVFKLK